ncbi:MAG: type IV secretory system conjugative DNA transfer family protein [Pseudomonadota bacterium]
MVKLVPPGLSREQVEDHLFGRAAKIETQSVVASARWIDADKLVAAAQSPDRPFYFGRLHRDSSAVFLGTLGAPPKSDQSQGCPIGWSDNRHIVTVAGSRAGKGQSAIIPNLHLYAGSVVCIDPKGENAEATASVRAGWHRQDVHVLDPFEVVRSQASHWATFNPLDSVDLKADDAIEHVALIADSLVVQANEKDAHWDESARSLIEALILFTLVEPRIKDKSLVTMRLLLLTGDLRAARETLILSVARQSRIWFPPQAIPDSALAGFDALLTTMASNAHPRFGGVIRGQANSLLSMGPEERGGVLSTARRNTKFIDGVAMGRSLSTGKRSFDFAQLKSGARGATVYIVLPARYMATHSRWVRLLVNCMFIAVEKTKTARQGEPSVLAILDEFPVLGYMRLVESAVGYMAGFGLKIWSIVQDLSQLKRHYPQSWETFLGNAGLLQFFGNTDETTLTYVSKRLGETEVEVPTSTATESHTETVGGPSEAERARVLHSQNASGAIDDDAFFESRSTQSGTTSGSSSQTTKTPLLTPDEVARLFSRESLNQLVVFAGMQPARLKRVEHHRLGKGAQAYWRQLVN